MATWEDGPEYAPIARPAEFADPAAPPLSQARAYEQMAALAPKDRPRFDQPPVPVSALADLHPAVESPRDPQTPFDVVGSTLTSDSGWGGVHWSQPAGSPSGPWGAPGVAPGPVPQQPIMLSGQPMANAPQGPPAPGTPGWFGPGAYGQPVDRQPLGARQVFEAATPGLLITLMIGGLVYVIAPITFFIGLGLSRRIRVANKAVRTAWNIGLAGFIAIAVLVSLGSAYSFSEWWGSIGITALIASWVMLVVTVLIVRDGLMKGESVDQGRPRTWG